MRGAGGTDGGVGLFVIGFALSALGTYLFFDFLLVSTGPYGMFSGMMFGGGQGMGGWQSASAGILFVPFFVGVVSLFYDSHMKWAWGLMWLGLAVIAIEILSRIRFQMPIKATYLLEMLALIAAGTGLMIRSYREGSVIQNLPPSESKNPKSPSGKDL